MSNAQPDGDIENLLERAIALPSARRAAFLDQECNGDPARRARIECLLRFAESADGFLERSPLHAPADAHAGITRYAVGESIGAYRLLRRLGTGGTAEVWLAERTEGGFQQRAAVKIVRDAQAALRERFAAEREILASLTHTGIARLYDGGVQSDGCAYMIMEYVEGEHLGVYAQAHALSLPERLNLFLQVCDAVAYAHTRLVVHRDIKPANVLVTTDGQVKLLDFGIAKLVDAGPARDVTGTLHMSPAYAAPEQLSGGYVSTATDVYALGVTLFELLTGRLPWSDDSAALATAVKRLMDASIAPPSRMAAAGSPVPARALRGDLDAIVARALRKEPGARYPDARALADDIRRHLDHQPVQARAGARAYVTRRFLRRNWLALATAAAVFVAMSIALVAIVWQAQRAKLEAQRAAAVQTFMVDLFRTNSSRQPDPLKARQTTARELLDIGTKRIESGLDDAPESKLELMGVFARLYNELGLLEEEEDLRRRAVALARTRYGGDSLQLANALIDLSDAQDGQARVDSDTEIKAILDRRGDTRSILRGRLLANMAVSDSTQDLERAVDEARQAVAILGAFPDSSALARALYLQGMTAYYGSKSGDAIPYLQRAIDVSRAVDGERSPWLANYYWVLASAQADVLQYAAAETSARQAVELALAAHSERPTDAIRAKLVLADTLARAGRLKEGLDVVSQAKQEASLVRDTTDTDFLAYTLLRAGAIESDAGELAGGLADMQQALALRRLQPARAPVAAALQGVGQILIETGQESEALQALEDARSIQNEVTHTPNKRNLLLRARAMFDDGRTNDARGLLAEFTPGTSNAGATLVLAIRRDLLEAEIDLADGNNENALRLAAEATARARSSESAPYLRTVIADGMVLEGIARTRGGEVEKACPMLLEAIVTRVDLYLPKSPKIAEAKLALAACELAQGRHGEALELIAQAKAIEDQHASLSGRYRKPLQTLSATAGTERKVATSVRAN